MKNYAMIEREKERESEMKREGGERERNIERDER